MKAVCRYKYLLKNIKYNLRKLGTTFYLSSLSRRLTCMGLTGKELANFNTGMD